jgi:hypothetical protein
MNDGGRKARGRRCCAGMAAVFVVSTTFSLAPVSCFAASVTSSYLLLLLFIINAVIILNSLFAL